MKKNILILSIIINIVLITFTALYFQQNINNLNNKIDNIEYQLLLQIHKTRIINRNEQQITSKDTHSENNKKLPLDMVLGETYRDIFPRASYYNPEIDKQEEVLHQYREYLQMLYDSCPDTNQESFIIQVAQILSTEGSLDYEKAYELVKYNPGTVFGR